MEKSSACSDHFGADYTLGHAMTIHGSCASPAATAACTAASRRPPDGSTVGGGVLRRAVKLRPADHLRRLEHEALQHGGTDAPLGSWPCSATAGSSPTSERTVSSSICRTAPPTQTPGSGSRLQVPGSCDGWRGSKGGGKRTSSKRSPRASTGRPGSAQGV